MCQNTEHPKNVSRKSLRKKIIYHLGLRTFCLSKIHFYMSFSEFMQSYHPQFKYIYHQSTLLSFFFAKLLTSFGLYGGSSSRRSKRSQSIGWKNGCSFTSPWMQPTVPNLFEASFSNSCKGKCQIEHDRHIRWEHE